MWKLLPAPADWCRCWKYLWHCPDSLRDAPCSKVHAMEQQHHWYQFSMRQGNCRVGLLPLFTSRHRPGADDDVSLPPFFGSMRGRIEAPAWHLPVGRPSWGSGTSSLEMPRQPRGTDAARRLPGPRRGPTRLGSYEALQLCLGSALRWLMPELAAWIPRHSSSAS